jgi:hypothetical protein
MEIYTEIPFDGFENYRVSNKGNVKNTNKNYILSKNLKMGYHYVHINKTNGERKSMRLHRLVALAFIPNGDDTKTFVNHIDGNKLNNDVSNLEWITPQNNIKHAYDNQLLKAFERKVCKYDLDGNLLATYKSVKEASEKNNIDDAGIVKTCKGRRQTAGGFKWKYSETTDRENVSVDDISKMKSIPDFPNYKISSDGRVYSINYKKVLKSHINSDGYETIQLQNKGAKKDFLMHRLVANAFIENKNNKLYVNHKDGDKLNNDISNLEWVTNSENMLHYHNEIKVKS